jgi:cytochrome c2
MGGAVLRRLLQAYSVGLVAGLLASASYSQQAMWREVSRLPTLLACHPVDPRNTAALQGSTLLQILGRPAGAIAGFDYSDAMRRRPGRG